MTFFMQLMAHIAHSIVERVGSVARRDAMFQSTLVTSILFDEVSSHESLAVFATLGGLGEPIQEFVRQQLADAVIANWDQVFGAASARYMGLSSTSLQPYVIASLIPNIVSPFHLSCQALCAEYVVPLDRIKLIRSPN